MRIVLVPRWGGDASSDWYPWITGSLDQPVQVAELDRPDAPTIAGCVASLEQAVGSGARGTVLVGHSVGCQAVVHFLAARGAGARFSGVLFVAGWWSVDEPWDTIQPWLDARPDTGRARAAAGRAVTLLSDNDPFTADHASNGELWRQRMGAEVRVVPGAQHFNASPQPAVLAALRDLLG